MKKSLLYVLIILIFPGAGYSCYEPSAPYFSASEPSVPWCVNEWENTHTCSDWEIDSYYQSIRNYNYEVENYVNELQNYVDDAVLYAQCEMNNI
jgi:hypothetical protein